MTLSLRALVREKLVEEVSANAQKTVYRIAKTLISSSLKDQCTGSANQTES